MFLLLSPFVGEALLLHHPRHLPPTMNSSNDAEGKKKNIILHEKAKEEGTVDDDTPETSRKGLLGSPPKTRHSEKLQKEANPSSLPHLTHLVNPSSTKTATGTDLETSTVKISTLGPSFDTCTTSTSLKAVTKSSSLDSTISFPLASRAPLKFWTLEEDEALVALISENGEGRWGEIAKQLNGRNGKQVRERWVSQLKKICTLITPSNTSSSNLRQKEVEDKNFFRPDRICGKPSMQWDGKEGTRGKPCQWWKSPCPWHPGSLVPPNTRKDRYVIDYTKRDLLMKKKRKAFGGGREEKETIATISSTRLSSSSPSSSSSSSLHEENTNTQTMNELSENEEIESERKRKIKGINESTTEICNIQDNNDKDGRMKGHRINVWTKEEDDRLLEIITTEINHYKEEEALKRKKNITKDDKKSVKHESSIYKCPRCGYTTKIKSRMCAHFHRKAVCNATFEDISYAECLLQLDGNPTIQSDDDESNEELEEEEEEEKKGNDGEMATFKITWSQIARQMPGRNSMQCNYRWKNFLNPAISKNPWTKEEDSLLYSLYLDEYYKQVQSQKDSLDELNSIRQNIIQNETKFLISWTEIAHALPGRSLKSCKARIKVLLHANNKKAQPRNDQGQFLSIKSATEGENEKRNSTVDTDEKTSSDRPKSKVINSKKQQSENPQKSPSVVKNYDVEQNRHAEQANSIESSNTVIENENNSKRKRQKVQEKYSKQSTFKKNENDLSFMEQEVSQEEQDVEDPFHYI